MSKEGVEQTILEKLVAHNNSTMGAMVARELLTKLSQNQRIALAGEVARARYKQKNSLTEVYRNAAYIANPLIMKIVQDSGYPVTKDRLKEFFMLGEKANGGSEEAKKNLKSFIAEVPEPVIQTLLPMYHEIIEDVKKESKQDSINKVVGIGKERKIAILQKLGIETKDLPDEKVNDKIKEVLNKKSEREVSEIRLNEAKIAFMGSVAFAFVEQRAFEMSDKQDVQKLQAQFRELRDKEPDLMSGLIVGLDKANEKYTPPRKLDNVVENIVDEVYTQVENDVKEVKKSNKLLEYNVKVTEKSLNDLCIELKKNINKDEIKGMEDMRSECGNIFNNLNVEIGLKGNKITEQNVSDKVKSVVNMKVNGHSLLSYAVAQGNKEGVEKLLKAGAEDGPSINYKRSFFQTLKDGFKDFPKNLKDLIKKPERTMEEIATIQGRNDIVDLIQKARDRAIPDKPVDSSLLETLQSTMKESVKPGTSLTDELVKTKEQQKGIFSKLKGKTTKEKQKEPTIDPVQTQIIAIDKRLSEIKEKENYKLPDTHPYRIALVKEVELLSAVRTELGKVPIDNEAVNKVIVDGKKEMCEYAEPDAGRRLTTDTDLLLNNILDAIEPPRATVGVKSGK